jgi:hypothetical protein
MRVKVRTQSGVFIRIHANPAPRVISILKLCRRWIGQGTRAALARAALSPYISGPVARCPYCESARLKKLIQPDRIDRFAPTFWSRVERLRGGGLYHCALCRIQFYDTRPLDTSISRARSRGFELAVPETAGRR